MNIEKKILNLIKLKDPDNPHKYMSDIIAPLCINKLNKYILHCNECDSCEHSIKSITCGNPRASILVIFDNPKENTGKSVTFPLEGTQDLKYFEETLDNLGINKDEIFYINSVNCLPSTKVNGKYLIRTPNKNERDSCRIFVNYAIKVINPTAILLAGVIAISLFTKESLSNSHGKWITANGIPAMPIYHPGYFEAIKDKKPKEIIESYKEEFKDELNSFFKSIQDSYPDNNITTKKL